MNETENLLILLLSNKDPTASVKATKAWAMSPKEMSIKICIIELE